MSISGGTVVVGARRDDDGCTADPDCNSGSAYVFERDQGGIDDWGEVAKLTASDAAADAELGQSVSISGDTVVAGAHKHDTGSAYVFERNRDGTDSWGEVAKLTSSDAEAGDRFGQSVSISGGTIVVGACLGRRCLSN